MRYIFLIGISIMIILIAVATAFCAPVWSYANITFLLISLLLTQLMFWLIIKAKDKKMQKVKLSWGTIVLDITTLIVLGFILGFKNIVFWLFLLLSIITLMGLIYLNRK